MSHSRIVIGITGTLGAGKGTVVEALTYSYGFAHFSVRGYLEAELEIRNLEKNRDNMTELANEIRAKHGASHIIEQLYQRAQRGERNAVIESIRTTGEVAFLKTLPRFDLLAVDAPPEIRYERILQRGSSTDSVSYEKFLADEKRESESQDPDRQNLVACIALADVHIDNGGSREQLGAQIRKTMGWIMAGKPTATDPTTPMLKYVMSDGMGTGFFR